VRNLLQDGEAAADLARASFTSRSLCFKAPDWSGTTMMNTSVCLGRKDVENYKPILPLDTTIVESGATNCK